MVGGHGGPRGGFAEGELVESMSEAGFCAQEGRKMPISKSQVACPELQAARLSEMPGVRDSRI